MCLYLYIYIYHVFITYIYVFLLCENASCVFFCPSVFSHKFAGIVSVRHKDLLYMSYVSLAWAIYSIYSDQPASWAPENAVLFNGYPPKIPTKIPLRHHSELPRFWLWLLKAGWLCFSLIEGWYAPDGSKGAENLRKLITRFRVCCVLWPSVWQTRLGAEPEASFFFDFYWGGRLGFL